MDLKDLGNLPMVVQAAFGAMMAFATIWIALRAERDKKAAPVEHKLQDPFSHATMLSFHAPQVIGLLNDILSCLRRLEAQNEKTRDVLFEQSRGQVDQTATHTRLMDRIESLLGELVKLKREQR